MPITDKYLDLTNNVWKWKGHADTTRSGSSAPDAPTSVSVGSPTQTSLTVSWTPATSTGITEVRLFRSNSATGTFTRVQTSIGNTATSIVDTNLAAGVQYFYKMTSYNATLNLGSAFSTPIVNGTTTNPPPPPGVPNLPTSITAIKRVAAPTTDITVSWTASAVDGSHAAATSYEIYGDATLVGTPTGSPFTFTWPNPGDIVTVQIKAKNSSGTSGFTTGIDVDLDDPTPPTGEYTLLMGKSISQDYNGHVYNPQHSNLQANAKNEAIRVYRYADCRANGYAFQTFPNAKIFGLTDDGGLYTQNVNNNGNRYNSGETETQAHWTAILEDFYYNANGTPKTGRNSPTTGIEMHICNGNEGGDKIASNATALNNFVEGCRRMYLATRTQNSDGTRRYPLASMWVDPTHDQEFSGTNIKLNGSGAAGSAYSVQVTCEAVAQYLDGIAWSMYPPGRRQTTDDPTYNWPQPNNPKTGSLTDAGSGNPQGFLQRCFYRTDQTAKSVGPNKKLLIAAWEMGTGKDPNDIDTRPWYMAYLARWIYERAKVYNSIQRVACLLYWDQEKNGAGNPQDVWPDEDQATLGNNLTRPGTGMAWLHWKELYAAYGGTKPSTWPLTATEVNNKGWKTNGSTYVQY